MTETQTDTRAHAHTHTHTHIFHIQRQQGYLLLTSFSYSESPEFQQYMCSFSQPHKSKFTHTHARIKINKIHTKYQN